MSASDDERREYHRKLREWALTWVAMGCAVALGRWVGIKLELPARDDG